MKTALALLLSLSAVTFAQELKKNQTPDPQGQNQTDSDKRRLQSVTWDLKTHKLVWVVEKGSEVDGKFVPGAAERYEITPEQAVMAFEEEKRGFTEEEATSLQHLLDVLSLYCAESTVWWDQGEGVPLDKNGVPTGPAKKKEADPKPHRVVNPSHGNRSAETRIASLGVR